MKTKIFQIIAIVSTPLIGYAHGSHGTGIMAGITHPIYGLDHAATLVGVGFLGYLIDQRNWYTPLLCFIAAMVVGGLVGQGNEATVLIEKIIAFSIIAISLLALCSKAIGKLAVLIALTGFGFVHGYAHGAEMPEATTLVEYVGGYTLGAAVMGFLGMVLSRILRILDSKIMTQFLIGIFIGIGINFLFF